MVGLNPPAIGSTCVSTSTGRAGAAQLVASGLQSDRAVRFSRPHLCDHLWAKGL